MATATTITTTATTTSSSAKFSSSSNNSSTTLGGASEADSWTPRGLVVPSTREHAAASPTRGGGGIQVNPRASASPSPMMRGGAFESDALARLQPAQVRELREAFQALDRGSAGAVGREDVVDMLTQLGLPSANSDLAPFFPPGAPQAVSLPGFLSSVATPLAALSPPQELLSAFAAFDEDDSGQVDLAELREALLNTAPDPRAAGSSRPLLTEREVDRIMNGFTGRKAFGRYANGGAMGAGGTGGSVVGATKRGEVFKYQEFVCAIAGGAAAEGKGDKSRD